MGLAVEIALADGNAVIVRHFVLGVIFHAFQNQT